jgi:CO/xanthine dehydrogenase FAD-binding subunit
LDAQIETSRRTVPAQDFFQVEVSKTTALEEDEIVTEIRIPTPPKGTKSVFLKFALRKSIDFPVVNCAAMISVSSGKVNGARICLNAVYVKPYRAIQAEKSIMGKKITEANAEKAGVAPVSKAKPLKDNGYMVQIAKVLVKRAILACK